MQPEIFVVVDSPETCPDACEAFALGFEGGKWERLFDIYGTTRNGFGIVAMADGAVEGRALISIDPWRYGPPIVIQPINEGRPTFSGPNTGVYWNGKEWNYFCLRQCEDR